MKNFILASSLAVLAAGKTTATPSVKSKPAAKSNIKNIRKLIDTERRSIRKAAKADTKVAKDAVVAAKTVAKEEGIVFTNTHSYSDFFEVFLGFDACDNTIWHVGGWETNRCTDFVIDDGNGMAFTESEMTVKPGNGGFPIVYFFNGHGCREDRVFGHWRFPKTEIGFPSEYTPGSCEPMFGGDSFGGPTHWQGAYWNNMRHEPTYPAVMQGLDGKDKGCRRNKFSTYDVISTTFCRDVSEDDSATPVYSKFDVTNCYNGTVEEKFYSDSSCTTMTHSEIHEEEDCVFDFDEFKMYLEDEGDAAFEYRSRTCTNGTAF